MKSSQGSLPAKKSYEDLCKEIQSQFDGDVRNAKTQDELEAAGKKRGDALKKVISEEYQEFDTKIIKPTEQKLGIGSDLTTINNIRDAVDEMIFNFRRNIFQGMKTNMSGISTEDIIKFLSDTEKQKFPTKSIIKQTADFRIIQLEEAFNAMFDDIFQKASDEHRRNTTKVHRRAVKNALLGKKKNTDFQTIVIEKISHTLADRVDLKITGQIDTNILNARNRELSTENRGNALALAELVILQQSASAVCFLSGVRYLFLSKQKSAATKLDDAQVKLVITAIEAQVKEINAKVEKSRTDIEQLKSQPWYAEFTDSQKQLGRKNTIYRMQSAIVHEAESDSPGSFGSFRRSGESRPVPPPKPRPLTPMPMMQEGGMSSSAPAAVATRRDRSATRPDKPLPPIPHSTPPVEAKSANPNRRTMRPVPQTPLPELPVLQVEAASTSSATTQAVRVPPAIPLRSLKPLPTAGNTSVSPVIPGKDGDGRKSQELTNTHTPHSGGHNRAKSVEVGRTSSLVSVQNPLLDRGLAQKADADRDQKRFNVRQTRFKILIERSESSLSQEDQDFVTKFQNENPEAAAQLREKVRASEEASRAIKISEDKERMVAHQQAEEEKFKYLLIRRENKEAVSPSDWNFMVQFGQDNPEEATKIQTEVRKKNEEKYTRLLTECKKDSEYKLSGADISFMLSFQQNNYYTAMVIEQQVNQSIAKEKEASQAGTSDSDTAVVIEQQVDQSIAKEKEASQAGTSADGNRQRQRPVRISRK